MLTAQLGIADSQLGQLVLGLTVWAFTVTAPDVHPVYAPLWLVEIEAA